MNPVLWGGVVVVLLILISLITMSKTRWGRSEQPAPNLPGSRGRVSGEDD